MPEWAVGGNPAHTGLELILVLIMSWTEARQMANRFLELEAVVDDAEDEEYDEDDELQPYIVPDEAVENSTYDIRPPSMREDRDEAPLLHALAAEFRRRAVADVRQSEYADGDGLLFAVRAQVCWL
ncbi:hypothetical protein FA95DRAFT_900556 [Auriscalpium vulgare]|uniref:Uncharacterized protein n=1 Tax=Auriscalpium vulgare TaxID=40419 RepID=A0ACB8R857_9AGAM|nr:hypothetical protein FA95DRAFT_900556 [Auriscalpium vulgare]